MSQAQPKKPGRSELVRNLLISKAHPLTVSEICNELGIPHPDKKFVSSICVTWQKDGKVLASARTCSVTSRLGQGYVWVGAGGGRTQPPPGAGAAPNPPPPKAPRAKKAKAAPPPPPPPRYTAQQQAKADAKRRAAEAAKKAREEFKKRQTATDELSQAMIVFAKFTGYRKDDPTEMKAKYREAAKKLHPDISGDQHSFASLANAWTVIKAARGL